MQEALLFVVIGVLLLSLLAVLVVRRRGSGTALSRRRSQEHGVLMVQLPNGRNEAFVLGSNDQLASMESAGLLRNSEGPGIRPIPQVVRTVLAAGGTEANRRFAAGIDSGRIVALTGDTMKQLEKGTIARDKAGDVLAQVRGKGRIAHVMRLDRAGAKAALASNVATLAMTAAVSQQLGQIEEQLKEIAATLETLKIRDESDRLGGTKAVNEELHSIAREVQRRGFMTDSDQDRLAAASLYVREKFHVADTQLEQMLNPDGSARLSRHRRVEALDKITEDLGLWLQLWVEAEMARTRRDVLHLYWEQSQHPEAAQSLAEEMRREAIARRERMRQFGERLQRLIDPASQTRFDPLQQVSRWKLEHNTEVATILARHETAFVGADDDPFAVLDSPPQEVLELQSGAD